MLASYRDSGQGVCLRLLLRITHATCIMPDAMAPLGFTPFLVTSVGLHDMFTNPKP